MSGNKISRKGKKGCFACGNRRTWKVDLAYVRSAYKKDDSRFALKQFKCCNKCSRKWKKLSEDEHVEL